MTASKGLEEPSEDGTFMLAWGEPTSSGDQVANERVYHVQLAAPPDEGVYLDWYQGEALESFVSGMPTGEVRVRVRARVGEGTWSDWSEPLSVFVEHHSMTKALGFFAMGLGVFSILVGYVAVMASRTVSSLPRPSHHPAVKGPSA